MPGPLSGMEAAALMMKREGYDCKFAIFKANQLNPFYGNFYLPDQNVFIMKREIMDGKSLMSLCIGCQLASSALRYKNGDMCKDVSTDFEGEYALRYKFKKDELEALEENTASTAIQQY